MSDIIDLEQARADRKAAMARHPSQLHKTKIADQLKALGQCPLCKQQTNQT